MLTMDVVHNCIPVDVVPDWELGAALRRQGTRRMSFLKAWTSPGSLLTFLGTGEVTANIATRSTTPLNDIVNLRRSCKVFRDATAARMVGLCMAVHKEWRLHWWDKARFLSGLRQCAASGNSEAAYILGLEEFCNR